MQLAGHSAPLLPQHILSSSCWVPAGVWRQTQGSLPYLARTLLPCLSHCALPSRSRPANRHGRQGCAALAFRAQCALLGREGHAECALALLPLSWAPQLHPARTQGGSSGLNTTPLCSFMVALETPTPPTPAFLGE